MRTHVDLMETLGQIVAENTRYFQSDFDMDFRRLTWAAMEPKREDRCFYWMSRPLGTSGFALLKGRVAKRSPHGPGVSDSRLAPVSDGFLGYASVISLEELRLQHCLAVSRTYGNSCDAI